MDFIKLRLLIIKGWIVSKLRSFLGIDADMKAVSQDITQLVALLDSVNKDVFNIFHGLPYANTVINLTAANASKWTNPRVGIPNGLMTILTHIVLAMRQGESYLQVPGEIDAKVAAELKARGFRIDETDGSAESGGQKGLFIVWS
jgi:hypothetical protein